MIRPEDCPYYLVSRATLVITSELKKGFTASGLEGVKPAYLGVLLSLWQEDGQKGIDLGRRAGLEPSTMTGLLDRMERDGLIARSADPNDRRVQQIHLTRQGKSVQAAVLRVVDQTLASVFAGVSERELSLTKNVLRRILANAHEASES